MFICPTCQAEYEKEEDVVKHYLQCWKNKNKYHQSKSAPYSGSTTTRNVPKDAADFFNSFGG